MRITYHIILMLFFILLASCKRKREGCMDKEAANYDFYAEKESGLCNYDPFLKDLSFELAYNGSTPWSNLQTSAFSLNYITSTSFDSFMPTHGVYYLRCVPNTTAYLGTQTEQSGMNNKHFKGMYFDYSYYAKGDLDSNLNAIARVSCVSSSSNSKWYKLLNESKVTYGGFPLINVQKKNEYLELEYSEDNCKLYISTQVTKGTFTFCIDNIRLVPR